MQLKEHIQKLASENEYLQVQLKDLNELIEVREEELELLREKARAGVEMQSRLENTLNEINQLQNFIGQKQMEVEGATRRENAMEEEVLNSLQIEKEYYDIKDKLQSNTVALLDTQQELKAASELYKELAGAKAKIAELTSTLEIQKEEIELLKYENSRLKKKAASGDSNSPQ